MRTWYLGIDTSNYTTSLAIVCGEEIIADRRKVLSVTPGNRGLRQSEAVFQHVGNLPELVKSLPSGWGERIGGIAVSTRPRPVEGSYLPVFRAGSSLASALAEALRCPLVTTTHQEGHIRSGLHCAQTADGSKARLPGEFMAVHISGGTTELLVCAKRGPVWNIELKGGTNDLHAGQFIDRVGVEMGLPFPAGPHLENAAQPSDFTLPMSVRATSISFSGPEAAARRALAAGVNPGHVAWAVEDCVARSLSEAIKNLSAMVGLKVVLIVGGVASNLHIRRAMAANLVEHRIEMAAASPELSSDNAVGIAFQAQETILGL